MQTMVGGTEIVRTKDVHVAGPAFEKRSWPLHDAKPPQPGFVGVYRLISIVGEHASVSGVPLSASSAPPSPSGPPSRIAASAASGEAGIAASASAGPLGVGIESASVPASR